MKFALAMSGWGSFREPLYTQVASLIEQYDFDALLITDHYMMPTTSESLDAWTLLAHLAARTSRVRLGTCVSPIPLRPPAILAKIVATLDVLSGGRVIVGVGAGWSQIELEAFSSWDPPPVRVQKVEEGVALMKRLWTEDSVTFSGRYYSVKGAAIEPKPVQKPHPPLWFGAIQSRMVELTARLGDGWIPAFALGVKPEDYQKSASRIKRLLRERGRAERFAFGYLAGFFKEDTSPPLNMVPFSKAAEVIEKLREAGCEYFAALFFPPEAYVEQMKVFAKDIVPSFQR